MIRPRRIFAALAFLAGASCSVDSTDLAGKHCPCADGWTCDTTTDQCVAASQADASPADTSTGADAAIDAADAAPPCEVMTDHQLWCSHRPTAVFATPHLDAGVVASIARGTDPFDCWSAGDLHQGGNTTWYHTRVGDAGGGGFVPGVALNTPDAFDANPTTYGLLGCAANGH